MPSSIPSDISNIVSSCTINNKESQHRNFPKMGEKAVLSCRGCLTEVDGSDSYFFVLKKVRDLFTGCTAIEILPEEDECFPQQLCSACYDKCKEWQSFKEMCQKVDKRLQRKAIESVPIQGEEGPTIRIKEEVMDVDEPSDLESFTVGEVFNEKEEGEDEKGPEEPTDNEDIEQCPVCDMVLIFSPPLKEHLKEHYSEENPKCPICDQQFTCSTKIYSHIMSLHMGGDEGEQAEMPKEREMEVCPVCELQTDQLLHHLTTVHYERGQVKCPVCLKNFRRLEQHLVVHTDEKPFPCGFCDISFKFKRNRLYHWRQGHKDQESTWKRTKQVQVECPICHNSSTSISNLHQHFVVHTDEQPYICNYCTFINRFKGSVQRHIRLRHPDKSVENGVSIKKGSIFRSERPWEAMGYCELIDRQIGAPQSYVCKVCAKGFSCQTDLLRHSVVHTKERPFKCVYCPSEFSTSSDGIQHVKHSHPKKTLTHSLVINDGTKYGRELKKLQNV